MPKKIVTYMREEKHEESEPSLDADVEALMDEPIEED